MAHDSVRPIRLDGQRKFAASRDDERRGVGEGARRKVLERVVDYETDSPSESGDKGGIPGDGNFSTVAQGTVNDHTGLSGGPGEWYSTSTGGKGSTRLSVLGTVRSFVGDGTTSGARAGELDGSGTSSSGAEGSVYDGDVEALGGLCKGNGCGSSKHGSFGGSILNDVLCALEKDKRLKGGQNIFAMNYTLLGAPAWMM